MNDFKVGLDKTFANFVPLSPLSFLKRAAHVFPHHTAVVYEDRRYTWLDTYNRVRKFASSLYETEILPGDVVSIMAFNGPELFEAHFSIPMIGAVIHAINTRLDAQSIAHQLRHSDSKVLIIDRELTSAAAEALKQIKHSIKIIDIDDPATKNSRPLGTLTYENMIQTGSKDFTWNLPDDEWSPIALGYTSGTTGAAKGVVTHHRGAYLNAISNVLAWQMPNQPVYLWTLPMFHCNGWCFPWTLAAVGGTNVCLRRIDTNQIYELIIQEKVSHYCGAPIIHQLLHDAPKELRSKKQHIVHGMIAAAPPPTAVFREMEAEGFNLTHAYGLTETYGPAVFCEKQADWRQLPAEERAKLNARQGVTYHVLEEIMIADPDSMIPVPSDGTTIGEIFMRGNNIMMGYLNDPEATARAFKNGWFATGDLGVRHEDGYIQIKDRSKDIIISGGENISSLEVEDALYEHPAVSGAAVVACFDQKWGETPCAFIELKSSMQDISKDQLINHCRNKLVHFKVPRHIILGPLPRTSTGKIQKFKLRDIAKEKFNSGESANE